jgi:hypothetical protein
MKLRYFTSAKMAMTLVLILLTIVISGSAMANSALTVNSSSGKYVKITSTNATIESDGLHIEGTLQSRHFRPRHPISGVVTVTVQDSAGKIVQEKDFQGSPLFVPKGIRNTNFSGVLDGSIPDGATVTVKVRS